MNRDKDVTRVYSETCLRVGREYSGRREGEGGELCQVDVIDTWGIMMAKVEAGDCGLEELLKDGVHLAASGNDVSFFFFSFLLSLSFPFFPPLYVPFVLLFLSIILYPLINYPSSSNGVGDFRGDNEDREDQIPGMGPSYDANARTVVAPVGYRPSRDRPLDRCQQAPSPNRVNTHCRTNYKIHLWIFLFIYILLRYCVGK